MKVCHIVNSFDPACDVLRCVRELNLYSRYSHTLYTKDPHPAQAVYQYEQPSQPGWLMSAGEARRLVEDADVLVYHFAGRESGAGDDSKPSAFRNLHVTWDNIEQRFWTNGYYDSGAYDRYKLVASSHVGALDYMPASKFRWLPDLLPLDEEYSFNTTDRPRPAVSYIKHADELRSRDFGKAAHLDCSHTTHADVLAKRSSLATVVIDNVSDGHYGLAGQEAVIMGLPVVVFNHPRTVAALDGWQPMHGSITTMFPFQQATTLDEAVNVATFLAQESPTIQRDRRHAIRAWAENFFSSRKLIDEYWDPFIEELAA